MMKRTDRNRALPLIAPVFILLLIASHATNPVSATVFPSSAVTINISQQALTLNYHLVLTENLTTLSPASASLDASNNSSIVKPIIQSIQSAMRKLTPKATVDESQFKLQTSTAEVNPSQGMWAIRLNMTIAVTGVETIESGGVVSYDTDFVSMNMSDPIQVSGIELNNVGTAVLLAPILSQPQRITTFYIDGGGPYSNSVVSESTTLRFSMLDFSRISLVSTWDHQFRPLADSSIWAFDTTNLTGGSMYNATLGLRSPEGVFFKSYMGFYKPVLTLTAPARAWAAGSIVSFNVSASSDLLPPLMIIVAVASGVGAYIAELRISKPVLSGKKKKRG